MSALKSIKGASNSNSDSSSIPLELIFNILLFLPAEILYSVMRLVCKDWCNIINDPCFVSLHLTMRASSPSGMVMQGHCYSNSISYVDTSGGEIELKKVEFPWKTKIVATCNGLWLFEARIDDETLYYVANPVTKKLLRLPAPDNCHSYEVVGLGYAASVGVCKAVCIWKVAESSSCYKKFAGLLTLGVDNSWRCITTDDTPVHFYWRVALPVKGFVYWAVPHIDTVTSLDVDNELFHSFRVPKELERCQFLGITMGDHLALLRGLPGIRCKLWVAARGITRAGEEWTMLPEIEFGSPNFLENMYKYGGHRWLCFRGWLKEAELLLMVGRPHKGECVVGNMKTGGICSLNSGYDCILRLVPYVPSLLSL